MVDLKVMAECDHLHRGVPDAALSPDFIRAYAQVRLDVTAGGHGLRQWADHAHAAYVGQWSLSVQFVNSRRYQHLYVVLQQTRFANNLYSTILTAG